MTITHSEALKKASEARAAGDRNAARVFTKIANDMKKAIETKSKSVTYRSKSGRAHHVTVGSESHQEAIEAGLEEISSREVRQIRRSQTAQPDTTTTKTGGMIVPKQTVRQDGEVLYKIEAGEEKDTYVQIFYEKSPEPSVVSETPPMLLGETPSEQRERLTVEEAANRTARMEIVGPPQLATPKMKSELREAGYDFPEESTIYISPLGQPYYYVGTEFVGPPEPTEEEMPVNRIYGPANLPLPGSLGEKFQDAAQDLIDQEEKLFMAITDPLREIGGQMVEGSKGLPGEGKAWEGFGVYLGGTALKTGAAVIEGATEIIRPGLLQKQVEFIMDVATSSEAREQVVTTILVDPFGAVMEVTGGMAGGYIAVKGLGKLADVVGLEKPKSLVRLEGADVDVKATALEMVDEVDPFTGKTVKVPQAPEVEIKPTISKKTLPKAVSEIIEPELDDLTGSAKILGVADEGGITVLEKIDVPGGVLDDLLEGKKVTVESTLKTETLKIGSETVYSVDDLTDPITGKSMKVIIEEKALPLAAKELGRTVDVAEDASKLKKLSYRKGETLLDDLIDIEDAPSVTHGDITFKGLWFDEGTEGVLGKGKRRYDVKGALVEATQKLDDVEDIKPIKPVGGKKTAWDLPEQRAAAKATLDLLDEGPVDPLPELKRKYGGAVSDAKGGGVSDAERGLIKDMTQGALPITKIVKGSSSVSPLLPAVGAIGSVISLKADEKSVTPLFTTKPVQDIKPIDIIKPIHDHGIITKPLSDIKSIITQKPIQDIAPIQNIKPIQGIVPSLDQDIIHKPVTIIKQRKKRSTPHPFIPMTPPRLPRLPTLPTKRKRSPRRRRRRPPMEWEMKKYRMPSPEDLKKPKRKRKKMRGLPKL